MRSRSAAAILINNGLEEVYSMEGGIKAWQGMVARGAPAAGMAFFTPATDTGGIIALAWQLEDGSRSFYQAAAEILGGIPGGGQLFEQLVRAEEHHKQELLAAYGLVSGAAVAAGSVPGDFSFTSEEARMEGGIVVREALEWIRDQGVGEILELSLSLEVNSQDLYIKMGRAANDPEVRKIFIRLAAEEQLHLEWLSREYDTWLDRNPG